MTATKNLATFTYDPLDLWSFAHLQESQFSCGLGEDWQEFTSCGCA